MKKTNTWQLVPVVLIVLIALYLSLDIPRPDWVRSLIVWQSPEQQDVAVHMGSDLYGSSQILLTADVPAGQAPDTASMQSAREIIENRVNQMSLTKAEAQVQGGRNIVITLPGMWDPSLLTDTIGATALVEFVDGGQIPPQTGDLIETTLGAPPVEEPTEPTVATAADRIYQTVFSSEDVAGIGLFERSRSEIGLVNEYTISFFFTKTASDRFASYTEGRGGQYLCITLDKEVLSCATLPDEPISKGQGSVKTLLTDEKAEYASAVLGYAAYGSLPVPLRVEEVRFAGPTLGYAAVWQSGRAVSIGLIGVLLFLLLQYRLPGALTSVAMVVFALLGLALCKLIPLPLILPSGIGFAVTALLALGAHLSAFELLREEARAGRPLSKAIKTGFTRAWPSIRGAHLTLLLTALATWYIGARLAVEAIHWMGVTLAIGALLSLFVTMVVTRMLVRLIFNTAQSQLSEHTWLLRI